MNSIAAVWVGQTRNKNEGTERQYFTNKIDSYTATLYKNIDILLKC